MGFDMRSWNNPINLDANNLNRLEQGIKNSHASIEIISEEVSNLQNKHIDLTKQLNTLTNDSPNILETLNKLNGLLTNSNLEAILTNTSNLLSKTEQHLTPQELRQVYKNLDLDSFIRLTSIKVNGEDIVNGSELNIEVPHVDTTLNVNSYNAISNKTVTVALKTLEDKMLNLDVEVPTKLSELLEDPNHLVITQIERDLWNSYNNLFVTKIEYNKDKESAAVADHKHDDLYAPLVHTHEEIISAIPVVPTNISAFVNDASYATEDFVKNNGGKIDSISVNTVVQPITNKSVNLTIPTDLGDLTNNAGYLKSFTETDPTVPAWAKATTKPFYTYSEILNAPKSLSELTNDTNFISDTAINNLISEAITNHNHDTVYAKLAHTHTQYVLTNTFNTEITNLTTALNNKANKIIMRGWS